MNQIEEQVEKMMTEILTDTEYELVDVEYVKEGRDWYLRIFLDKEGGIDLEDCSAVSEQVSERLDKVDLISSAYNLEISSPGIDRILKKDKDYVREAGKVVDVTFYAPINGNKNLVGELVSRDDKFLYLKDKEPLPREKIALVRLHIEF